MELEARVSICSACSFEVVKIIHDKILDMTGSNQ